MKKEDNQSQVLLSLSEEIVRIRGKQDMMDIIFNKLKKHIQFDDSFIFRYNLEKRTCWPFIYHSKKARSKDPHYKDYVNLEYHVSDDTVDSINYPQVYQVEDLLPLNTEQIKFMHNAGIKEFVVIKLIEGNQLKGLFVLLSEKYNSFKPDTLDLLHKLSYQISIATANIIANEEIEKREEEKTILVSLSAEIAILNNRSDLLQVVNERIKNLFSLAGFAIAKINEDGKTYSAFMMDLEDRITDDVEFKKVTSDNYDITDMLFSKVMQSEDPVVFNVNETADLPGMPAYVHFWKKVGLHQVLCAALKAGGKNVGMGVLHIDTNPSINPKSILLKGIFAQLSVAISNILGNEKILRADEEKSLLLSFSKDIATVRDRDGLRQVFKQYLKNIFHIKEYIITLRNNDGETYSYFLHDSTADDPDDEGWKIILSNQIPVKGAFIGAVLQSKEAIFDLKKILEERKFYFPAATFWNAVGAKRVMGCRLKVADKDVGLLVIQPGQINNQLLNGIAGQLAIAIANIIAIEEIVRRENEKSMLLSFASEIAAVRNKDELLLLLNDKLKNLFPIKGFGITLLDSDGKMHSPFVVDVRKELKGDNSFKEAISKSYSVTDGVFNLIVNARDPLTLVVEELARISERPAYVDFWVKMEIQKVTGIALRVSDTNLGCFIILQDNLSNDHVSESLLRGVSAQISVAISNIKALEEIIRREEETSTLLSISREMAVLRNRDDLFSVVIRTMKELFTINEFGIGYINDNNETYSSFTVDKTTKINTHEDFDLVSAAKYSIHDPVFSKIINTEDPVFFRICDLSKLPNVPSYVSFWRALGFENVLCVALKVGRKNIGCAFLHFDTNPFIHKQLHLIKAVCAQLSVAISNILGTEKIKKAEEEKSMLLEFSNSMASARDKESLSKILNWEIKKLFGIKEYAIHLLSEDKKTHRGVFFDPEADFANHPLFVAMTTQQTDVNDGVFNIILASDGPVIFDAQKWVTVDRPPSFASAAIDIGLQKMIGVRIHLGGENIAVLNLRYDSLNLTNMHYPLLQGICSQIAVGIANIQANEKVLNQLNEINKYKSQLEEEKIYLKEEIETSQNFSEMIGDSTEMKNVFLLVEKVAASESTVLLLGETGTGKELIARAIHNASPRKSKLMVKVNCAAIPANLIESELFGHERGSFTGATERRIGKFELAHNGTLFLDEIGEMPLEMQVKLLRALQEKEIERVGGKTTIKTDVRIIAATNRNLEKMMEEGKFRNDLYYRLNIFPIALPPLRTRKEDIPALALHFVKRFSTTAGRKINSISNKALRELTEYNWPGNIRELEHLIERSILLTNGDAIKEILLPSPKNTSATKNVDDVPTKTIDENEREYILKVLKHVKGRVTGEGGAAELLDIPPSTLNSRMKRLGIRKEHLG